LAFEQEEIRGTLLVYTGYRQPIVWVQGSTDAVTELICVPELEKPVFNVPADVVYEKLGFKKFREGVWLDMASGITP
jgi:hypothetical protein